MKDYIEREALRELLRKWADGYSYIEIEAATAIRDITAIPAADVRPVVRGEWLTTDAFPHRVYCSICYKTYVPNDRWQIWVDGDLPRAFCPNCGADMRKGEQDEH